MTVGQLLHLARLRRRMSMLGYRRQQAHCQIRIAAEAVGTAEVGPGAQVLDVEVNQ